MLALVGAVIGGIWVASAKFYEDYKVNKIMAGILTMMEGVRRVNQGFTPNQICYACTPHAQLDSIGPLRITNEMYNAGALPKDMFESCFSYNSYSCISILSKYSSMTLWITKRSDLVGEYDIQFDGLPESACIKLGLSFAGKNFSSNRIKFVLIGVSVYTSESSIALNTVKTDCQTYPQLWVGFLP